MATGLGVGFGVLEVGREREREREGGREREREREGEGDRERESEGEGERERTDRHLQSLLHDVADVLENAVQHIQHRQQNSDAAGRLVGVRRAAAAAARGQHVVERGDHQSHEAVFVQRRHVRAAMFDQGANHLNHVGHRSAGEVVLVVLRWRRGLVELKCDRARGFNEAVEN